MGARQGQKKRIGKKSDNFDMLTQQNSNINETKLFSVDSKVFIKTHYLFMKGNRRFSKNRTSLLEAANFGFTLQWR